MNRAVLAAATMLAVPVFTCAAGWAQPIEGLYVGGAGGANFLEQQRVRTTTSPAGTVGQPGGAVLNTATGVAGLGSVGWGFGNGVRVEVEGNFRQNDRANGFPAGSQSSGYERKYGAMANVLFDMDIGSPWVFPYLGAGAGYQWVEQHMTTSVPGTVSTFDGTDGDFAYQAMLGADFPVPGVPGLSGTAEYRFLGMIGERSYSGTATRTAGPSPVPVAFKTSDDNNHALLFGLRYAFNVAPPPAPPASTPVATPQPAPARSYLVFFDWDRADLTDRARQIIAEAAQASSRVQTTRIEVAGHADRTGTAAYNQALSLKRAQAVGAELVRLGVPQQEINIQGYGDTRPLVPTAAGVREPQNRRVEIVLK